MERVWARDCGHWLRERVARELRVWLLLSLTLIPIFSNRALAYETDLDLPVSPVVAAAGPDLFTGTMAASIPIEVPPGRRGVQPNLRLIYRGGHGNGSLGIGWKLELGGIERQSRFGVDFTGEAYVLRLNGVATELIKLASGEFAGEYRAKIEGVFYRIKKLTASDQRPYWELTDAKGTRYLFGQTAASRQDDPTDANRVFKWCLDRVVDPNGNEMLVSYFKDQGQSYLDQITYAGSFYQVKVYRELRPNASELYATGIKVKTGYLQKAIEVSSGPKRIRVYALGYTSSQTTGWALLQTVQQFGNDANVQITPDGKVNVTGPTSLPPYRITYQTDLSAAQFNDIGSVQSTPCGAGGVSGAGDFNGDGQADLWCHESGNTWVSLTAATGAPTAWNSWRSNWCGDGASFGTGDFNGDGKTDVFCHVPGTTWVSLSSGTAFLAGSNGDVWRGDGWCGAGATLGTGDFNGDGKVDISCHAGANTWVSLSSGTAFVAAANGDLWRSNWCVDGAEFGTGDFNGDGKTDISCHVPGTTWVLLSNGTAFVPAQSGEIWQGGGWCGAGAAFGTGDFNGDGKTDVSCHAGANTWIGLSSGTAFVAAANGDLWRGNWCGDGSAFGTGDFNGDGKTDIFCHVPGTTWVSLSSGTAFLAGSNGDVWHGNGWCGEGASVRTSDFNGDGKADIWCDGRSYTQVSVSGAVSGLPDSLLSVENGLGGKTTVTSYGSFTQLLTSGTPFTIQTVRRIDTTDGNGNTSTTTYDFGGGFYHVGDREFRGFNQVTVTGPAGLDGERTVTLTYFHQGNDLGLTNAPDVSSGYMRGKLYLQYVMDGQNRVFTTRSVTHTSGKPGNPWFFNPPLEVITQTCDGTACTKSITVRFTYDEGYAGEYGNITQEVRIGTGTPSRTIARSFDPNTQAWIVSLPYREIMSEGEGTGVPKASTSFYYDGVSSCYDASAIQRPAKGNLTRVVRGLAPDPPSETRFAYSLEGNPSCKRDPNGNITTFYYGAMSQTQLSSVTNALSQITNFRYSECGYGCQYVGPPITAPIGLLIKVEGLNNDFMSLEYDAVGRPTRKIVQYLESGDKYFTIFGYPSWGTVGLQALQTTTYPRSFGLLQVPGPTDVGLVSTRYFDGFGRTIKETTAGPDGKLIAGRTEYDPRGAIRRRSLPYFEISGLEPPGWTIFSYDSAGRLTQVLNPDGTTTRACEDDWVRVTIDPKQHRRRETRDAFGRLVQIEEYTGTFGACDTGGGSAYATTTYQYDVLGNLLALTDAKGNRVERDYDSLSRPKEMRDPDLGRWVYQYDPVDNLVQQTDARLKTLYLRYDKLNRLVQKDYDTQKPLGAANADVVYKYDEGAVDFLIARGKGRLTTRKDAAGQVQFGYDAIGRVIRQIQTVAGDTKKHWFTYDGLDRLTSVMYYDNSLVGYTYNGPWLQRVYEGTATYAQYAGYNALGQPGTVAYGDASNQVATSYTYEPATFRLKTLTTQKGSNTYQSLGYAYDLAGNITAITDAPGGNQTFTYDELDRLTSATGPYGSRSYAYDSIGNLTNNSALGAYTYTFTVAGRVLPHAVSQAGPNAYTYDAAGNLLTGAGRSIQYDTANRPTTITASTGTTTFVYDGDGSRVKKTVSPLGGTMTAVTYFGRYTECDTGGCVKYIWAGDRRIAMKQASNGSLSTYHTDHLSSTRVVTDGQGNQQETVTYEPFGLTTRAGTVNVPYKYTGQELDASTGLYYYKARYYDATLGRFIQPDTVVQNARNPQAWSRYSYVLNNPLKYSDPTGYAEELTDLGLYFASVQGFDSTGYSYAFNAISPLAQSGLAAANQSSSNSITGGLSIVYQGGLSSFGYDGTSQSFSGSGVEEIAKDLEEGGQQVERLNSGQIERGVSLAERANQAGRVVNAVGHSFGADAVVDVSRLLDEKGIPVNVLVTIDAVGLDNTLISKNVGINVNFIQQGLPLPGPFCLCGRENVAVDPSRTLVINILRPEGHFGIVNADPVRDLIKQLILGR